MKPLLFTLLLAPVTVFSQTTTPTYDQQLKLGNTQVQAKDYCAATATFERAFGADSTRANEFELFTAATAAANCPARRPLAWRWLGQLSRRQPLRMSAQDLDNVANDPTLVPLKTEAAWPRWLATMRQALAGQASAAQATSRRWVTEAQSRTLVPATGKARAAAQSGFALYFSAVPADTVKMPYLVRVPQSYDPTRPTPVVVYLHGGVVSTKQFQYADPDVMQEPIFAAAPANALVVYPFGRTSFGWVEQPAAFAQIERIMGEVKARYRTDTRHTLLGGMSNGGSAALWFASQRPNAFSGFYALSPAPTLPLQAPYKHLGQGKPCYQISTEDDGLYAYSAVKAAYDSHHAQAPQWFLQTLPTGGHGFLYRPGGEELLRQVLAKLSATPAN